MIIGVLSASWALNSARAYTAQAMYFDSRFGDARTNVMQIVNDCSLAHELYPYNYYYCWWAAINAYNGHFDVQEPAGERLLSASKQWCDTGLELNFTNPDLRLLKTWLLERDSKQEAVRFWEAYVDWQYWEPVNHAFLAELYADVGDFESAYRELKLIRGFPEETRARAAVKESWARELRSVPTRP